MSTATTLPVDLLERMPPATYIGELQRAEAEVQELSAIEHEPSVANAQARLQKFRFIRALLEMDIPILTDASVKSYQAKVLADRGTALAELRSTVQEVENDLLAAAKDTNVDELTDGGIFNFMVLGSGIVSLAICLSLFFSWGMAIGGSFICFGVLFITYCLFNGDPRKSTQRRIAMSVLDMRDKLKAELEERAANALEFSWATCSLRNYGHRIPTSVLRRTQQICEAYPNAQFEVEYLDSSRVVLETDPAVWAFQVPELPDLLPDPFLVAYPDGRKLDRAVIGVWDEPEYEIQVEAK